MRQNRRQFMKIVATTLGAATFLPMAKVFAQEKRRGGGAAAAAGGDLPLVKPGVGMAASLNYHHSTSDVKDAKLKTDRQGVPFANQTCSNCMLYNKHGMQGGDEVGKCTLFQGQVVKAKGWCSSWTKKA